MRCRFNFDVRELLDDFPRRYYEDVAARLDLLAELVPLVAVDLDSNSVPRLDNDGMDCYEGTVVGKQQIEEMM